MASLKLTEQINTDLLCFVYIYSKGIRLRPKSQTGFWHLTLCTLLSSQGSGAPATPPRGFVSGQLL
jgi:hypothetical protein